MEIDLVKRLNCLHADCRPFTPFLKCKECGVKICSNCKVEWLEGHQCDDSTKLVRTSDQTSMKDKFG